MQCVCVCVGGGGLGGGWGGGGGGGGCACERERKGLVWRKGRLMGDLDVTFFSPLLSFHWTDAPQDATLLSW